jgi:hypothetical protein
LSFLNSALLIAFAVSHCHLLNAENAVIEGFSAKEVALNNSIIDLVNGASNNVSSEEIKGVFSAMRANSDQRDGLLKNNNKTLFDSEWRCAVCVVGGNLLIVIYMHTKRKVFKP